NRMGVLYKTCKQVAGRRCLRPGRAPPTIREGVHRLPGGSMSATSPAPTSAPAAERTTYRIEMDHVEACNCRHGCNCQFGGFPNEGKCEFIIGYHIRGGGYGNVDLAGTKVVVAMKYPGAIHEGNGRCVLFVGEGASPEQVKAIDEIWSGRAGGMPWEALAGTLDSREGPLVRP